MINIIKPSNISNQEAKGLLEANVLKDVRYPKERRSRDLNNKKAKAKEIENKDRITVRIDKETFKLLQQTSEREFISIPTLAFLYLV